MLPSAIVAAGEYALFQLKSDQYAIHQLLPDTAVTCGRKGDKLVFDANEVIGQPWGLTYEVTDGRKLRRLNRKELLALQTDNFASNELKETLEGINNQWLHDDNTSQALSEQDVRDLKECDALTSEELVQKIAANSTTFDSKTMYAQAKWIKRKLEKHGRYITVLRPDAFHLWPYYFGRPSSRPRLTLRGDALSQILAHLNVHAGTRGLVVDDAYGVPTLALLERMNGKGRLLHIHELVEPSVEAVQVANLSEESRGPLRILPATRIKAEMFDPPEIEDGDVKKLERRKKILEQIETQKELHAGGFDLYLFYSFASIVDQILNTHLKNKELNSLLVVTLNASPHSIFAELQQYVAPSRPIILFRNGQAELLPAAETMRYSEEFLDSNLLEPWSRTYQVLPERLHPEMTSSSNAGFILKTIKATAQQI